MTHGLGWRGDSMDQRDRPYKMMARKDGTITLPRAAMLPYSRPILDQGSLGSCTAHGGERVMNAARAKRGLPFLDLSRLALYWWTRFIEGTTEYDSGAEIRDVIKALIGYGMPPESDWPYQTWRYAQRPSPTANEHGFENMAVSYHWLDNEDVDQIRNAIAIRHVPVVFGTAVFTQFEYVGAGGFVASPGLQRPIGGHCMVIEGYDDDITNELWDGGPGAYWVANSWGTAWGKGGYCWIPYSYLADPLVADDFWTVDEEGESQVQA